LIIMAKDKCDVPVVMVGISDHDADLYYVTKFLAPDAFAYVCADGEEYVLVSTMEKGRAEKESRVKNVISLEDYDYTARLMKAKDPAAAYADTLAAFLKDVSAGSASVPEGFPLGLADRLRSKGIKIEAAELSVEETRMIKTPEEIELIRQAQLVNEKAQKKAIGMISSAQVRKGILHYRDQPLTAPRPCRCQNG
jgi:Xaa-Pro aminopeptidase